MRLGKPERNGPGWRYKKMFKGKMWKSSTFSEANPENKLKAWKSFLYWQISISTLNAEIKNELVQILQRATSLDDLTDIEKDLKLHFLVIEFNS